MYAQTEAVERVRLHVVVRGAVQGVGFRPFVYQLAEALGLPGWVNNSVQGVFCEVEGPRAVLEEFLVRLVSACPPRAVVQSVEPTWGVPLGFTTFEIRESVHDGAKSTLILPDGATCPACVRELFDPANRRYRYPFINCTHCGPRYSIIEALPYDRPNTTMKQFALCPACRAEYGDPHDRRFHAQPNACSVCGPQVAWWDAAGQVQARGEAALQAAEAALCAGQIVALKGLGGFQLLVDARDEGAVQRLRQRKQRAAKPFAVLYPTLAAVQADCELDALEEELLLAPEAPIVLVRARAVTSLALSVAPGVPCVGVLLPYTPLHHLLMADLGFPIIATSGNLSDEPICIDEHEAVTRLGGIADGFLVHDRPIARHVDDSVVRVMLGRAVVLRRARGYAPFPVELPQAGRVALAVGAHAKNSLALAIEHHAFISQHIGDLENAAASAAGARVARDLVRLYDAPPAVVACDLHPDYRSTRYAERLGLPLVRVQHHYAHVLACMAEQGVAAPVLGVAWDGTGYGPDGTVWGGEFLLVQPHDWVRVAHLRQFRLPGGEQAVREPRRAALGVLYALLGDAVWEQDDLAPVRVWSAAERRVLTRMLAQGVSAPLTSSAGRLFDAVAALLGLCQVAQFEGQGALWLESACATDVPVPQAHLALESDVVDWGPLVQAVIADVRAGVPVAESAAHFHAGLAALIVAVARRVGEPRVVLSGGCFQNLTLLTGAVHGLTEAGFQPVWHEHVPPNDGGIALGQLLAVRRAEQRVG